jgi:hypothetical protein
VVVKWRHACGVSLGRVKRALILLVKWQLRSHYIVPRLLESSRALHVLELRCGCILVGTSGHWCRRDMIDDGIGGG